jgi:hypothetical protein
MRFMASVMDHGAGGPLSPGGVTVFPSGDADERNIDFLRFVTMGWVRDVRTQKQYTTRQLFAGHGSGEAGELGPSVVLVEFGTGGRCGIAAAPGE